jgi:coenzyme F420-reducing hydrogenase alpha subunit
MSRTLQINPVTRIEGHAKVNIEIGDDKTVKAASMHVLEFRGFEKFVEGMQAELMPTLTTRICGTCPHAHHLVSAKCLDRAFSAPPPRAAVLLRELLNCGSIIHSHAVHFFALAGPDLFLGLGSPVAKRNLVGLLEAAPHLATKALRLRSIGAQIVEIVGGRATHPVTAVAGGMSAGLTPQSRDSLRALVVEGFELAKVALAEGKKALGQQTALLSTIQLAVRDMGTVKGKNLDLYDGTIRVRRPDKSIAVEFEAENYRTHLFEQAFPDSYGKEVRLRDPQDKAAVYRVGPLARVNCADAIDTPAANAELGEFKKTWGDPCDKVALGHYARLIELLYCAEKAAQIVNDDEIMSTNLRTPPGGTPKQAAAHVEAPRGVLIHDYDIDANGIIKTANFVVATQHNIACINASIKDAAAKFLDQGDQRLMDGVEFAIRCYDPCLSCSTHCVGQMPLDITITRDGQTIRTARR